MFLTNRAKSLSVFALVALIALAVAAVAVAPATLGAQAPSEAAIAAVPADEAVAMITGDDGTLRFEVAEDATRFVWDDEPVFEDGLPTYGNSFITQGYIYPAGTLDATTGVLADGSPEFPDQVLGEWTCRGWFVGDGVQTETGPWVMTTQIYNFGDSFGDAMLVTEGYEVSDVGVAGARAITGGTGPFATARGDGEQTLQGFNATEGVTLSFEIEAVD